MTVEEALYARLAAALGHTRIYPVLAPQNVAYPCVVYTRISAERVRSLAGPSGLARPRFQLDVYAADFSAARTAFAAVRLALDGWRQGFAEGPVRAVTLDTDQDLFDEAARLHRVTADFFVTHDE